MGMLPMHFAAGMLGGALLGALAALARRRALCVLPVVMSACGFLALVPEALGAVRPGWARSPLMDLFFFHHVVRQQAWLQAPAAVHAAFHLVVGLYVASAVGYVVAIRRRLPTVPYAREALAVMARRAEGHWAAAPAGTSTVLALVPLLVLGVAVGWVVRLERPGERAAAARAADDQAAWWKLVSRRLQVEPRAQLGLVRALPWAGGEWARGCLLAQPSLDRGAADLEELARQARTRGWRFLVLRDPPALAGAPAARREAYAQELARAAKQVPEVALLRAQLVPRPAAQGATVLSVSPVSSDADTPPLFLVDAGRAPDQDAATARLLFTLSRDAAGGGVVLLGLPPRSGEEAHAADGWDPRVAQVGGTWDRLLDAGVRVWGAAAAADGHAGTRVWCPPRDGLGPRGADVLAALRAGCFWAAQGGLVERLELELAAPHLERPARMGEVVVVPPGAEVTVTLSLQVPPTDAADQPLEGLDAVELVSNVAGEARVVATFADVRGRRHLRHVLPAATDRNGGLGFYVRARGCRRDQDGREQWFHTNPIRVLVRDLPPPPREPRQVASAPPTPKTGKAAGTPGTKEREVDVPRALSVVGFPTDVPVLHIETFRRRPGGSWTGQWSEFVARRGPGLADDLLSIRFQRTIAATADARLFFRIHTVDCADLAVLVHTDLAEAPYRLTRVPPDRAWAELDLALGEDFFAPEGAPPWGSQPTAIQAIEWRASGITAQARFHLTDVVLYRPTPSRRRAVLRQRLKELAAQVRHNVLAPSPSARWRERLDALTAQAETLREQTDPGKPPPEPEALASLAAALDALFDQARRLSLETRMARAFLAAEPAFAVGIESAARRVSARHPTRRFAGEIASRVKLHAAAGEAESIQLVVLPLWEPLRGVRVAWSELRPEEADPDVSQDATTLPPSALSAQLVDEVHVPPRGDLPPERTGWTPDPLRPLEPFDVDPGSLRAVLLTVRVPPDLPPGDYRGTVTVSAQGCPPVELALTLHRWDVSLLHPRFPVLAPVDEAAMRQHGGQDEPLGPAARHQLYALLLDHRVGPVPDLRALPEGEAGEATLLEDAVFCIERGLPLAVLFDAGEGLPAPTAPGLVRAGRLARRLWADGHGRVGAALLSFDVPPEARSQAVQDLNALAEKHADLAVLTRGEGDPPYRLRTDYWLRPLADAAGHRPPDDIVEVRRSRTAQREAWHLRPGSSPYPHANATLVNRLVDARLLPWLAWRHGIRALLLPGATAWDRLATGDGALAVPGPGGRARPSLRLVALRDGIEECDALWRLWQRVQQLRERAPRRAAGVLAGAAAVVSHLEGKTGTLERPTADPEALDAVRLRLGRILERLDDAWWNEVERNARGDLPAPPLDLAARGADHRVVLTWSRSPAANVGGYHLYRSTHPRKGFARVNRTRITATRFVDHTVANGIVYHYYVRAARAPRLEGPRSERVKAMPTAAP